MSAVGRYVSITRSSDVNVLETPLQKFFRGGGTGKGSLGRKGLNDGSGEEAGEMLALKRKKGVISSPENPGSATGFGRF